MATLGPQITSTGVITQTFADLFAQLQNAFWSIYGTDAVLDADSQDGQWLAVLAQGYFDCGQAVAAAYANQSPSTAQGAGLSSVIKINGIRRETPTNSQVPVTIVGVFGTVITNGIVGDNLNLGTQWTLPASVTIPQSGQIAVTATCTATGSTPAPIGTITKILTPTLGWQTASNSAAATPGNPVETDAALRQRQANSTAIPAQTILDAIQGAVANLSGVSRLKAYENDTGTTDGNGIPGHSISLVVEGGSLTDIATEIALKGPGAGTYGTTQEIVIDAKGVPNTINFFVLATVPIFGQITIEPLAGFVSTTEALIIAAVAGWINGLDIGQTVYLNKLWAPANLSGTAALAASAAANAPSAGLTQAQLDVLSATYDVTAIEIGVAADALGAADITIPFNEAASAVVGDFTVAT